MSKFYFGLIGDLRRSLFLIASSQVTIPVFFTLNVDYTLLDTGKVRSISVRRHAKDWEKRILDFLIGTLGNDEFMRFDFRFSYTDIPQNGHYVSVNIDIELAKEKIILYNEKKREGNRIKHNQTAMKELQDAYLSQDVNNNDFEEGSRLPSIED